MLSHHFMLSIALSSLINPKKSELLTLFYR